MPWFGVAVLAVTLSGCYTMQPAGGIAPEPGRRIALELNDAGRLALGGQIGPGVSLIEGRLISRDSQEYLLAVNQVTTFRGGTQVWSGERLRVHSDHVGSVYERQFSAARSVTMGVIAIGGFTAFILGRELLGINGGGPDDDDPKPDPETPVELIRP